MRIFEITFILLLMIPVALLMRYFVSYLSKEKPKQKSSRKAEQRPSVLSWYGKRKRTKKAEQEAIEAKRKAELAEQQRKEQEELIQRRKKKYRDAARRRSASPGRNEFHRSQRRPAESVERTDFTNFNYGGSDPVRPDGPIRKEYQPGNHRGFSDGGAYPSNRSFVSRSHTALRRTEKISFEELNRGRTKEKESKKRKR